MDEQGEFTVVVGDAERPACGMTTRVALVSHHCADPPPPPQRGRRRTRCGYHACKQLSCGADCPGRSVWPPGAALSPGDGALLAQRIGLAEAVERAREHAALEQRRTRQAADA